MRPSWDIYFLDMCRSVASRSHDEDTKVGCVIVSPRHRVLSTGYNGLPAGVDDAKWATKREQLVKVPKVAVQRNASFARDEWKRDGQFYDVNKYATVTHAEANAIVSAGKDLTDAVLYCLLFPCNECAKLIITAGIKRVVFDGTRECWEQAVARELFYQADVEMYGPDMPCEFYQTAEKAK